MIYKLRFSIEHDEDWTMLTDEFDIKMKTISYFVGSVGDRYVNVEIFNIRGNSHSNEHNIDLDGFVRQIKKYNNVFKVKVLNINNKHRTHNIDILTVEDYAKSIRKLINDNFGFFTSTISQRNLEEYEVIFPLGEKDLFRELRQKLNEVGDIKNFEVTSINEPTYSFGPTLTERERDSIQLAWHRGFFDYPKGVKLDEMAKVLNIKKSTLDFHIRKAIKKSIQSLIEAGLYDWM